MLHERSDNLFAAILNKVCKASASVRLNARDLIVKSRHHSRHGLGMEGLLEIVWHIISELTNAMKTSISDLRVLMLKVRENRWHHRGDLLDFIDILSDLRECHDTSVLVAPVSFISNSVLHKSGNQRKHVLITNTANKPVNGGLTEVDVVFFLVFTSKTFLRAHPVSINVSVNVNHKLEDGLKNILG